MLFAHENVIFSFCGSKIELIKRPSTLTEKEEHITRELTKWMSSDLHLILDPKDGHKTVDHCPRKNRGTTES